MRLRPTYAVLAAATWLNANPTIWDSSSMGSGNAQATQSSASTPSNPPPKSASGPQGLPRGKRLVLKDGTYQLVRSYEKHGERVRYFSAERGDWEEIPDALIDWDATAKAEAGEKQQDAALVEKVHIQEEAAKAEAPLDIDASLLVAPGVFLPPGEGMFAVEGKSVTPLGQVGSQVKTDKKTFLKQVFSPIPVVPSKRNIEIPGARASTRITTAVPEFYLREAPPDLDRTTPIQKSSRPGESGPEVQLVRAKVKGNKRLLESIRSMFGEQLSEDRDVVSMQRWDVATTVFRFTLSEPLPPGEYALAEILPDGMNLYVWDFGVDGPVNPKTVQPKKSSDLR